MLSQDGLSTLLPKMTLSSWSSFLHILSPGIVGLCHHIHSVYMALGVELRALWMLEKHSGDSCSPDWASSFKLLGAGMGAVGRASWEFISSGSRPELKGRCRGTGLDI